MRRNWLLLLLMMLLLQLFVNAVISCGLHGASLSFSYNCRLLFCSLFYHSKNALLAKSSIFAIGRHSNATALKWSHLGSAPSHDRAEHDSNEKTLCTCITHGLHIDIYHSFKLASHIHFVNNS